jgi:hypothetical protein
VKLQKSQSKNGTLAEKLKNKDKQKRPDDLIITIGSFVFNTEQNSEYSILVPGFPDKYLNLHRDISVPVQHIFQTYQSTEV